MSLIAFALRRHLPLVLVAAATLAGARSEAADAPAAYRIDPHVPLWIEPLALPDLATDDRSARRDARLLVDDRQVDARGKSLQRYFHQASQVASTAGIEDVSEIHFDFDPAYEQLTLHSISIHRGSDTIDALASAELRTVQQEQELDRRIYNGQLALHAILHDVRVGDVVEYAFSISGSNPALAGGYDNTFYLARYDPVGRLQVRLLWPRARRLTWRAYAGAREPEVRKTADAVIYRWRADGVAGVPYEDKVPHGYRALPQVSVSDFGSWADVVAWGMRTWAGPSGNTDGLPPPPATSGPPTEEAVLEVIRQVQDEIRYLGIEMGPHSLEPHAPGLVLERRFGDCKDKALLLVSLLRRMGVEANPVLVDSYGGDGLEEELPSPGAFDHVIAQIVLDRPYYIDATATYQRGSLAEREDKSYRFGLVLKRGERALTALPHPALTTPNEVVTEVYTHPMSSPQAELHVTTVFRGDAAVAQRRRLASTSLESVSRDYENFYTRREGELERLAPLEVQDDTEGNVVTIKEAYRLLAFWDGKHEFDAWLVSANLERPDVVRRSAPLAVAYPLNIEQHIVFDQSGEPWNFDDDDGVIEGDALSLSYSAEYHPPRLELTYHLESRRNQVPAASITRHLADLDRISENLGYEIHDGYHGSSSAAGAWILPAIFMLAGGGWLVRRLRQGHRRRAFASEGTFRAGEAPHVAIAVPTSAEAEAKLTLLRCACGAVALETSGTTSVRYDERTLTVFEVHCRQCLGASSRYFAIPEADT